MATPCDRSRHLWDASYLSVGGQWRSTLFSRAGRFRVREISSRGFILFMPVLILAQNLLPVKPFLPQESGALLRVYIGTQNDIDPVGEFSAFGAGRFFRDLDDLGTEKFEFLRVGRIDFVEFSHSISRGLIYLVQLSDFLYYNLDSAHLYKLISGQTFRLWYA